MTLEQFTIQIHPEQTHLADQILEEAGEFGVDIHELKYKVGIPTPDGSIFAVRQPGLMDLRWLARAKILEANGADPEDIGITSQLRRIKEEAFHRGDSFPFVVWKDHFDRIVAQGEMRYMTGSEVYKKLMALGPTNRGWERVACWDLGNPEFYLDENSKNFQKVHPKSQTFLFKDELEKLKADKQLVTYTSHSIYEEGFEAYLVDENEYQWPTLYKARGYLLD
jgi:hypothetical protein